MTENDRKEKPFLIRLVPPPLKSSPEEINREENKQPESVTAFLLTIFPPASVLLFKDSPTNLAIFTCSRLFWFGLAFVAFHGVFAFDIANPYFVVVISSLVALLIPLDLYLMKKINLVLTNEPNSSTPYSYLFFVLLIISGGLLSFLFCFLFMFEIFIVGSSLPLYALDVLFAWLIMKYQTRLKPIGVVKG